MSLHLRLPVCEMEDLACPGKRRSLQRWFPGDTNKASSPEESWKLFHSRAVAMLGTIPVPQFHVEESYLFLHPKPPWQPGHLFILVILVMCYYISITLYIILVHIGIKDFLWTPVTLPPVTRWAPGLAPWPPSPRRWDSPGHLMIKDQLDSFWTSLQDPTKQSQETF